MYIQKEINKSIIFDNTIVYLCNFSIGNTNNEFYEIDKILHI
jgi:hypothetical protein